MAISRLFQDAVRCHLEFLKNGWTRQKDELRHQAKLHDHLSNRRRDIAIFCFKMATAVIMDF